MIITRVKRKAFCYTKIKVMSQLISVVVPLYNESAGISDFHKSLLGVLEKIDKPYELIYVDDGSSDETSRLVKQFRGDDKKIRLIKLSRNFGKEIATTAGMHIARGQAIITLDADGQHPVELIPDFIKCWEGGSKVVIGLRTDNQKEGFVKRFGSKLFYKILNRFTKLKIDPRATDFRLVDNSVRTEFARMTERNRITRGLIDWLGYERSYIKFKANPRLSGDAGYSFAKLFKLAIDSIISLSVSPLYIVAYIGAIVLPISAATGLVMVVNAVVGDPLGLNATGTAYVVVLLLFLVGVLLVSQGIIGLYLSHIHTETQNRPLYIVDTDGSIDAEQ